MEGHEGVAHCACSAGRGGEGSCGPPSMTLASAFGTTDAATGTRGNRCGLVPDVSGSRRSGSRSAARRGACGNSDRRRRRTRRRRHRPTPTAGHDRHRARRRRPDEDRTRSRPPGSTTPQIGVAVITTTTQHPIGGNYGEFADGIQAYFDMINSQGGIYGRKLKIVTNRDDTVRLRTSRRARRASPTTTRSPPSSRRRSSPAPISSRQAKQPTFIWNINPEMFGHSNIFGTEGALCFTCVGQGLPWLAQAGALHQGRRSSRTASRRRRSSAATAFDASFKKYPSAQVRVQGLQPAVRTGRPERRRQPDEGRPVRSSSSPASTKKKRWCWRRRSRSST